MSWFWLGLLILAGVVLWLRHRAKLRRDAMLQESIDRVGAYQEEPKVPPAKQPWRRPGFGPPARMSRANLGSGPLPPPAGELEDPTVAGPVPDEDDVPALIIPIEPPEPEGEPAPDAAPASVGKPPPPPPPGAGDAGPVSEASDTGPLDTVEPVGGGVPEPVGIELPEEEDVEAAVVRGPRVLDLPPELAEEVRGLMADKQEVAAVRLVCDSMGVGILDAQRTVRALVGR
jgi:hypothetical protein